MEQTSQTIDFLNRQLPIRAGGELTASINTRTMAMGLMALSRAGFPKVLPNILEHMVTVTVHGSAMKVRLLPMNIGPQAQQTASLVFTRDAAWGGIIAPLQMANRKLEALETALQTVRGLLAFQAPHGGIYWVSKETSDSFRGYYPRNVSNADTLTVYHSFQLFIDFAEKHGLTQFFERDITRIMEAMRKIEEYLLTKAFDKNSSTFFAASYFNTPGSNEFTSTPYFATDAQALDLDVELIDTRLGPGTALKIWRSIKRLAGCYTGEALTGLGIVAGNNPHCETSLWGIGVAEKLASYYEGDVGRQLSEDAAGLRKGLEQFKISSKENLAYREAMQVQKTWWGKDIIDGISVFASASVLYFELTKGKPFYQL